ncbi:MAG: nucleoside-diphosphate sugar epimerase/dehydratase [Ignavibacteria bacterium]|nr:nucleoside-diphosphate sugar epimerase/dehydratase [Ignavibacteria bacterium]
MNKQFHSFILGIRNRHLLGLDVIISCLTPSVALLLTVENAGQFHDLIPPLATYTAMALTWKLLIFFPTGLYDRYWRYASVDELATVSVATGSAGIVGIIIFFGLLRPLGFMPDHFPRSVPVIEGLLTILIVSGVRFGIRLGFDLEARKKSSVSRRSVLIAGAGVAGSMIVKELRTNQQLGLEPRGFVDDDKNKLGVRIHGVQVLGTLSDLPELVKEHKIAEVIIAMPAAPGKVIRDVVQSCKTANVVSKTIPGIFEILGGWAKVAQIRDVQIEDLLRRGVVKTDIDGVAALIRSARVMVTGAGGSIGGELCRQISEFKPAEIVLVGHGENSIIKIAADLQRRGDVDGLSVKARTVVADIRDRERMKQVFELYEPQIVFHAAAHKHVPLMEANMPDAITNNVMGTQILVELAEQHWVERFVMISSDKAVNPTSIMGVTKRIAELIVHDAWRRSGRSFVTVRFGNVLGSSGSVVPIFKKQIEFGEPISVTHPDVKRYFMTIPEAVQLVLQAAGMGEGGEVFVLDMGEPLKILDLARDLIRLSRLEEGRDIDIVYTGLRVGEKLTEELFFESEKVEKSNHEKIFVCRNGNGRNSGLSLPEQGVGALLEFEKDQVRDSTLRLDVEQLISAAQQGTLRRAQYLLRKIVPEFQPSEEVSEPPISRVGTERSLASAWS